MGMVDGKITGLQPIVEESFLTELTTGIFSSPIIIIPHSHFDYVDTAICTIIERCKDTVDSSCLKISEILEFNEGVGVIDFLTKKNSSCCFKGIEADKGILLKSLPMVTSEGKGISKIKA